MGYYTLKYYQRNYPDLTFQNIGYQYISPIIREKYSEQISEISKQIKKQVSWFVKFNNFKIHKEDEIVVRFQGYYDSSLGFIGVVYMPLEHFKQIEISKWIKKKRLKYRKR